MRIAHVAPLYERVPPILYGGTERVVYHLVEEQVLVAEMLGLEPEARRNRLTFVHPVLPDWLPWVEVRGLRLGASRIDVKVRRDHDGAGVEVLDRDGDAEVVVRR